MSKLILDLQRVSFAYQHERVISQVSLRMQAGDFLGLVGPNGGGKSTLLKLILGLLTPSAGQVKLLGQNPLQQKYGTQVGYVAQKNFTRHSQPVTVQEVLSMTGANANSIERSLELVEMARFRHQLITELSGGQEQRVFIARALLHQPVLLILDEPTVGVDQRAQDQFYQLLTHLNQEHQLSIILVSHETELISRSVTSLACINRELIYHGQPQALQDQSLIQQVYGQQHQPIAHHH